MCGAPGGGHRGMFTHTVSDPARVKSTRRNVRCEAHLAVDAWSTKHLQILHHMEHDDEVAAAFGEFIRAQRKLANLSQRTLGRMSGVSDSYLSQMERGMYRPSPEIMKSLAKAFNMSPSVLYAQFGLMDDESEPTW